MRSILILALGLLAAPAAVAAPATCTAGDAAGHACERIDLLARLDLTALGYGNLNDVWGWTDAFDGREYALVGATAGTVFVDITDPSAPRIVGRLPAHENVAVLKQGATGGAGRSALCQGKAGGAPAGPRPLHEDGCGGDSTWRNVKVHADHAYIGSESAGHGLQVFDLTQLRAFPPGSPVQLFGETAHYAGFGHSHTLWIDEANAMLYAVGSDTYGGGPHFVDLSSPAAPLGVGGYAGDGYSHEILCQSYSGPDADHAGAEICIASNEDTITILDVSNKAAPVLLSRLAYPAVGYTHQGYLTADQRYLFVNDELDELDTDERTRTLLFDLADLDAPALVDQIRQPRLAIDHNLYLHQGYMFQSDYTAGLVVYDARDPLHAFELGYFDTFPDDDDPRFAGTWSNYPFFGSGVVAISDITRGLYLVQPQLGGTAEDAGIAATPLGGDRYEFTIDAPNGGYLSFSVGVGAEILALNLVPANQVIACDSGPRAVRCRVPPTLVPFGLTIDARSADAATTELVAMLSGPGDESAPVDNRVVVQHATSIGPAVIVTPTGGGGGAAAPALVLLLLGAALLRRRVRA